MRYVVLVAVTLILDSQKRDFFAGLVLKCVVEYYHQILKLRLELQTWIMREEDKEGRGRRRGGGGEGEEEVRGRGEGREGEDKEGRGRRRGGGGMGGVRGRKGCGFGCLQVLDWTLADCIATA